MNLGLADQTAIVFGAARGIGLAIAKELANEGARVILADRDPLVVETAARIPNASSIVADVCDSDAVNELVNELLAIHGRIDHAVYAVGIGSGQFGFPFWNVHPAAWAKVIEVNVIGAVNVAWTLGPVMAEAKRGSMLFLASVAGQIGSQTDPPYSASKAALINFMQCAAKDLAPFGVRVNALNPGMVKTELNKSVWQSWADRQPPGLRIPYETWAAEKIAKIVPLGRWQTPEDVAAMAAFLCSDRAANITGQTINIDGGYVMHS
jgi:NAD(P)-dependent dehydrogenase (short-subunit alcohol dehydrogenase family)